jgi:HEPN domain-containing protein
MSSHQRWSVAYRGQARADYQAALLIANNALTVSSASVVAMLLQMALEKFLKAAVYAGGTTPPRTHRVDRFLSLLRRDGHRKLKSALDDVRPTLVELVELHPALFQPDESGLDCNPQLEYPWLDSHDKVCFPAQDLSLAIRWSDASNHELARVRQFMQLLNKDFDTLFPA